MSLSQSQSSLSYRWLRDGAIVRAVITSRRLRPSPPLECRNDSESNCKLSTTYVCFPARPRVDTNTANRQRERVINAWFEQTLNLIFRTLSSFITSLDQIDISAFVFTCVMYALNTFSFVSCLDCVVKCCLLQLLLFLAFREAVRADLFKSWVCCPALIYGFRAFVSPVF